MQTSDINGQLMLNEMKKLVNIGYLSASRDGKFYFSSGLLITSDIETQSIGIQLATLMDLKLIPIDEIAKVFGSGVIKTTITY